MIVHRDTVGNQTTVEEIVLIIVVRTMAGTIVRTTEEGIVVRTTEEGIKYFCLCTKAVNHLYSHL
jgi:hypothetical protein